MMCIFPQMTLGSRRTPYQYSPEHLLCSTKPKPEVLGPKYLTRRLLGSHCMIFKHPPGNHGNRGIPHFSCHLIDQKGYVNTEI